MLAMIVSANCFLLQRARMADTSVKSNLRLILLGASDCLVLHMLEYHSDGCFFLHRDREH